MERGGLRSTGAAPARLARILLVEDDDGDALLEMDLLTASQPEAEVSRVATLEAARELLRSGWDPEVVLVDLGLPDGQGVGTISELVAAAPHVALIVLTGQTDTASGIAAVAAGAQDYLVKGQVDQGLLSRSIRYGLERKRVEESQRELMAADLRALENRRLERGLLPAPRVRDPHLRVYSGYRPGGPTSLLGGDFYDVVEREDGSLHVVLGDVSGHGPDEAALGVLLRAAWRALVLAGTEPARVLPLLSELLRGERRKEGVFATGVYLVVSDSRTSATVFNAGHPRPLSVVPGSAPWPEIAGLPLGIGSEVWGAHEVDMAGRWPLLLYTDGLIEGRAGEGRLHETGLVAVLREAYLDACPLDQLIDRLIGHAEDQHGGPLPDDVAMLIIEPTRAEL